MSTSKKLAVAALAGLLSTSFVAAASAESHDAKTSKTETTAEKHACKGDNSCKGDGKSDAKAHGEKAACKGKDSCAAGAKKEIKAH